MYLHLTDEYRVVTFNKIIGHITNRFRTERSATRFYSGVSLILDRANPTLCNVGYSLSKDTHKFFI